VKSNKKQPQIKYVSCGLNKYNEIIVFIRYDNVKKLQEGQKTGRNL
jgi:hypothetical protein